MKKYLSFVLAVLMIFSTLTIAFAEDDEPQEPLKYVVLGDSIGYGAGIINHNEACYGRIVANTNGYDYVNYAHNGDKTWDLLSKLDNSHVINDVAQADIISISIGGNNILQGNIPLAALNIIIGNNSYIDSAVDTVRRDLGPIIEKIKAVNEDVLILMQTVYSPSRLFKSSCDKVMNKLNGCIYDYLEENPGSFEIVDVFSAFSDPSGLIAMDGIHPSAKGNIVIAETILEKLAELGYGETTEAVILVEPADTYSFAVYYLKVLFAMLIH